MARTRIRVYACTKGEYDAYQEYRRNNPGKRPICGHVYEADTYGKAFSQVPRGAHVYKVSHLNGNQLVESHLESLPWNIQW